MNFSFLSAFNQTLTVQPDGYITLHNLGELRVEGKTIPELTQELRAVYSKLLKDPALTVELKDFEKPYFIAGGEVERPGKYELRSDTTVAQGVAIAGGFKEYAKPSQVLLFRQVSEDWVEVKQINVKSLLARANLHEDLHLQPGDTLYVPKSPIGRIRNLLPRLSLGLYIRPTPY